MIDLPSLGWDAFFAEAFRPFAAAFAPGRVSVGHKDAYGVYTEGGELSARVVGRVRHRAAGPGDLPAVGDWVAIRALRAEGKATIHAVLPRRSAFTRGAAGKGREEQVVAANVDAVFLVSGLDRDFNLRRLERYLVAARHSGAAPVIVLNKADLCGDVAARWAEVEALAPGVPVHVLSALRGDGVPALHRHLGPGRTVALLGSSGAGKSTLINRLLGEDRQPTRSLRARDGRGRHTTTRRELLPLPGGGLVIDTPGLRELKPWDAEEAVPGAFSDLETLARDCHFRDCRHAQEPRCAVQQAVAEGRLARERLESHRKLRAELEWQARRQDRRAEAVEKKRIKAVMRAHRNGKPR